jgi:hypothetical protein
MRLGYLQFALPNLQIKIRVLKQNIISDQDVVSIALLAIRKHA